MLGSVKSNLLQAGILKSGIWRFQNMMYLIHNVEQADYSAMNPSVSVLSISRTTPFHHHKTPPGQLRSVEMCPGHTPLPVKEASHEFFCNPLHGWLIQPVWLQMSENIGVEKVMSHKQNQQQSVGGIWVVMEAVFHVPIVLQVFDSVVFYPPFGVDYLTNCVSVGHLHR